MSRVWDQRKRAGGAVDHRQVQPDTLVVAPHAAAHHVTHAQIPRDVAAVDGRSLVGHATAITRMSPMI